MTAAFAGSDAARAVIGFATSVAVGRGLGADAFGRWTLCLAWAATLTVVFDLGFAVLLTREAARPGRRVGTLIGGALAARLLLFLPAALLVFVAAARLAGDVDSVAALRVGVFVAAFGLAYGCFAAVLRAAPKWLPVILAVETGGAAIQAVGAVWIVRTNGGIASLLAIAASIQLVQLIVAASLWRISSRSDDRLALPSPRSIWATLRQGVPFAAAGLAANAQSRVAPLALGYYSTTTQLAAFGAAWRLGNAARRLPHAVFGAALPVLSHEFGTTAARATRVHAVLQQSVNAFAVAAALAVIAAPEMLLRVTYGSGFVHAADSLRWIGVALLPLLTNASRKIYLYARGEERIALRWSLVALIVQLGATLALIPPFGAAGAAAALAMSEVAVFAPLFKAASHRQPEDTAAATFSPVTGPSEDPAYN